MSNSLYLRQEEFERIFKQHLKISTYSMSIKTLFGERLLKKIIYDPYYQRNYVWDNNKATFFIESILLGTDIPPLIFFNSGGSIEVIDGRQRFETIKRFKNGVFSLTLKGLDKIPQLKKSTFGSLDGDVQQIFDNAKIRIFEFEVINKPQMDHLLEDKIKKEIFRRYNSGITPLNSVEIDNATYDDDDVTNILKKELSENKKLLSSIVDCFLGPRGAKGNSQLTNALAFLRRYLVMTQFPISAYAGGSNRKEIIDLYYDFLVSNTENTQILCEEYLKKIKLVISIWNSFKLTFLKQNKLIFECILWAIDIIYKEKPKNTLTVDDINVLKIETHYQIKSIIYSQDNSFYYKSVIDRFKDTADFFSKQFNVNFKIYLKDELFRNQIRELRQSEKEAKLKLEELEGLRANKPDPSIVPVDEIINELGTTRYLLRPSYQRQERISVYKASAIIESILLGINLPPIFIYKNNDGVKEVVDGQQRLIAILGYLGKQYLDEENKLCYTNLTNYTLKKIKILKEHKNKSFSDLDEFLQDRILDFRLQIIEIDERVNPKFEPVDLFIRLNNKPYPIKENSFEMWNSFVDKDVIQKIKTLTDEYIDWFFLKGRQPNRTKDRMHNEEMITMLSYISFRGDYKNSLGVYLRDQKLNCRMREKRSISVLLEELSIEELKKKNFLSSINRVSLFISKLSKVLGDKNKKKKLNELLGRESVRSLVDFYMLFLLLGQVKETSIISYDDLKSDLSSIQNLLRNSDNKIINETYLENFHVELEKLIISYSSK